MAELSLVSSTNQDKRSKLFHVVAVIKARSSSWQPIIEGFKVEMGAGFFLSFRESPCYFCIVYLGDWHMLEYMLPLSLEISWR